MAGVLRSGIEYFVLPVFYWSGVFMAVTLVLGLAAVILSSRWRARRTQAGEAQLIRIWAGRAVLAVGCFAIPLSVATFHSVPFAVTRGLAAGIEQAAPEVTGHVVDWTTGETMQMLGIDSDQTLLDLRELKAKLARMIERPPQTTPTTFATVFSVAQIEFLKVVARTVGALDLDSKITWQVLARQAKQQAVDQSHVVFGGFVIALRTTATAHLYWASGLVVLCQFFAFGCYALIHMSKAVSPH